MALIRTIKDVEAEIFKKNKTWDNIDHITVGETLVEAHEKHCKEEFTSLEEFKKMFYLFSTGELEFFSFYFFFKEKDFIMYKPGHLNKTSLFTITC